MKEYQNLKAKVAELLVVRASGHPFDSQREYPKWEALNKELQIMLENGLGGVILYGGTVEEIQARCATLQSWSKHPILLCADVEEGVGQRFQGASWLPPPMALGRTFRNNSKESIRFSEEYGKCIGDQARRCGLNWVLAPVCDVNTNPMNPVINMRAWGEDPNTVTSLVRAFYKGLVSKNVLSCAKHFPGHGDTTVDSHLDLPILENDLSRLNEIELIPFKELIDQGINSVMTAHVLLKNIDPQNIATFSKKLLQDLLREKLGFDGLIVTDALVMKAISDRYGSDEAAVRAIEAGADLILMPENPLRTIDAIVSAVINGRIDIERIEQSITRRRFELSKLNQETKDTHQDLIHLSTKEFEAPHQISLIEGILDKSIEIRNYSQVKCDSGSINLVRVDSLLDCPHITPYSPSLVIPNKLGYDNIICHKLGVNLWQDDIDEPLNLNIFDQGSFMLQLFVRGNPFKGSEYINEPWIKVIEQLQSKTRLSALFVYGSFYFWRDLLQVLDSSVPTAYSPGQMPLAQTKLLKNFFNINKEEFLYSRNLMDFTN